MATYQKITPKKPKPRATPRIITDEDIDALLRLAEKWGAKLMVKRSGTVIIRVAR